MDSIEPGEILEVLADDPAAEEDIKRYAKRTGHEIVKFEKRKDHIRFLIKKSKWKAIQYYMFKLAMTRRGNIHHSFWPKQPRPWTLRPRSII
jgi:hypothetical protein